MMSLNLIASPHVPLCGPSGPHALLGHLGRITGGVVAAETPETVNS
jgi:hypothetical protein